MVLHLWRAFAREQRGSTMTEFVVCLPLFMLIFSGLSGLWTLAKTSVNAKTSAHYRTLAKVKQQETHWSRYTPRSELFRSAGDITSGQIDGWNEGTLLEVIEFVDGVNTGSLGHWGESYIRGRLYGLMGGGAGTGTGDHALQEMKNIANRPDGGQWLAFRPSHLVANAHLTQAAFNDTVMLNWDGDNSRLGRLVQGIFNSVLGGPMGLLAGIRYGAVDRDDPDVLVSPSVEVWGQTFSFPAGYGSLLAPQPVDDLVDMPVELTQFTGVSLDAEQIQWLYHYGNAQLYHNYRELYDVFQIEIDNRAEFTTAPYPDDEKPAYEYNDFD